MSDASFTGERLSGADVDQFRVDMERHIAAYRFAESLAAGRSVLDAGCGEGYGSAHLAKSAARVVGIDRPEAVATATARYRVPNLTFRAWDLARLGELGERFDLVVSFQVIEHLPEPEEFLAALAARVAPGGALVVTTPNRLMTVSENPYHLREWSPVEMGAIAARVVPAARLLGVHGSERVLAYERKRGETVQRILRLDPLNLRRLLPAWVVHLAFPRLARLVRRQLTAAGSQEAIGPDDFSVHDRELDRALDLLLLIAPGVERGG